MATPKILVVDDQPINVQLLKRKLEREGMAVATAYSGQEALNLVASDKPDLILLDVMMPEMDGIEVCQRLQADLETKSIPIIFITARTSKEGKIEGLGVGAVDYITKPIDLDETLARVQTQLRFVQINRELVDLQRRLGDSRRAATIGAVTQGIAHNLNNLLGVVIGYVDLIKAYHEKPELVKKKCPAPGGCRQPHRGHHQAAHQPRGEESSAAHSCQSCPHGRQRRPPLPDRVQDRPAHHDRERHRRNPDRYQRRSF
ncbi:MAG: response regulator [Lacunisphaera sp.]